MKKSSKKQQITSKNKKITAFFTKCIPVTTNATNTTSEEDDIVNDTPIKQGKQGTSKSSPALEDVTNTNSKKRKILPSTSNENPPKKVCCKVSPGLCDVEKTPNKHYNLRSTPDKNCTPPYNLRSTPSKFKTPLKSSEKCRKTPSKSPGSRKTPKKLFEKSPNVKDFQVNVLKNFVKVTPTKLEREKIISDNIKGKEMENFVGTTQRSAEAQNQNEKTPVNKPQSEVFTPPSARVKIKLDFASTNFSGMQESTATSYEEEAILNELDIAFVSDDNALASEEIDIVNGTNTYATSLDMCNKLEEDSLKESKLPNDFAAIDIVCSEKGTNCDTNSVVLGEMFEDSWDAGEFDEVVNYTLNLTQFQHCKVLEISKTNNYQKIILQSNKSKEKAICTLTQFWADTLLKPGCSIHISGIKNAEGEWILDNNNGLLVYEPDFLISSTSVVGALFCKRRSVLKSQYAGFDSGNKVMLVGTLVHTLLQTCLKGNVQTPKDIGSIIENIMSSREVIEQLYDISVSKREIEAELKQFEPRIITFIEQYLKSNTGKQPLKINKDDWRGKIDDIQDIEENIWCPEYGLKGKVDISIKVQGAIMPLELKTGRASMSLEHRGQIILYIMMMNKLGYKAPSGLLLYLRESVLREIPMSEKEKRDLLILRNNLAYYLTCHPQITESNTIKPAELPPPINHHSACGKCEYNTVCCAYLKSEEVDLKGYRYLEENRDVILAHLEQSHVDYFIHFSSLLSLESGIITGKQLKDIYTQIPEEREKTGKCIINVKIFGEVQECNSLYSTTFKPTKESVNLLATDIGEHNYIVVSSDKRPALATGLVSSMVHDSITIELDRNLTKKYGNQNFHLDTYDSNNLHVFYFTNLALLIEATPRADQLRKLIIDRVKPTFKKTLPSEVGKKSALFLKKMNKGQQNAVIKAIAANDYLLIKGMPGTGKTSTIVALVQLLVELNQSVLIMSHTNAAVDNMCIRLKKNGVSLLRLGSETRIHPIIKPCSEYALTRHCKTPEELEVVYNSAKVLAVTCIGTRHPILSKRNIDVCIVDEATQVLQCSVIRALHSSKKFILIGDPEQLPPVVKNRDAMSKGLSESLFKRLLSPETVITLNLNYRMNKPITALANDLTYQGELLTANNTTATATLQLPNFQILKEIYINEQWILKALNNNLSDSVCVLNTGPVWDRVYTAEWIKSSATKNEEDSNFSCTNPSETAIVVTLVYGLIKCGVQASSIGVIAPYRAQVAQLSTLLRESEVDVNTVDQFQGQDKDVILYSCTKSRDTSKPNYSTKFALLEDKRRLTVAITRAKHKLIIVADVETVKEYAPFSKLFKCIGKENYINLTEPEYGYEWQSTISDCEILKSSDKKSMKKSSFK